MPGVTDTLGTSHTWWLGLGTVSTGVHLHVHSLVWQAGQSDCDRQRLTGQTFHLQQHCAYILYHCANILATQGVQSHTTQTNQPSLRLGQVRHRGQTYLRYCGGESGPLRGVGPVMVWRVLEAPCVRQHMKLMAFGLCWNETSSIQEDGDWLRCGSTSLLIGNLTVVVTACDISLLSRPASTARVTAIYDNIYICDSETQRELSSIV